MLLVQKIRDGDMGIGTIGLLFKEQVCVFLGLL